MSPIFPVGWAIPNLVICSTADSTVSKSSFVAWQIMDIVWSTFPAVLAWSKMRAIGFLATANKRFWEKSIGVILKALTMWSANELLGLSPAPHEPSEQQ